jgi:hypothetical protein
VGEKNNVDLEIGPAVIGRGRIDVFATLMS